MDLLKDRIGSLYQKFLWPSLFAALVTTIYSFVDTIAIGKGVGPDGAAAGGHHFSHFRALPRCLDFCRDRRFRSHGQWPGAKGRRKRATPITPRLLLWCW